MLLAKRQGLDSQAAVCSRGPACRGRQRCGCCVHGERARRAQGTAHHHKESLVKRGFELRWEVVMAPKWEPRTCAVAGSACAKPGALLTRGCTACTPAATCPAAISTLLPHRPQRLLGAWGPEVFDQRWRLWATLWSQTPHARALSSLHWRCHRQPGQGRASDVDAARRPVPRPVRPVVTWRHVAAGERYHYIAPSKPSPTSGGLAAAAGRLAASP
jgi:hypothetical protein